MKPCCAYQGGKERYASAICEAIGLPTDKPFFDLCCGSGAVSIEAVRRGQKLSTVTMVDAGPWGMLWEAIGNGSFFTWQLEEELEKVPEQDDAFNAYMYKLAAEPLDARAPYVFLILQSASFVDYPIWVEWCCQPINYWGHTSNCKGTSRWVQHNFHRQCINKTRLVKLVSALVKGMRGVRGIRADINSIIPIIKEGIVYIDPPYRGTSSYGHHVNGTIGRKVQVPCWVSEGEPLTDHAICLSNKRANARMNGSKGFEKVAKEKNTAEWLSYYGPLFPGGYVKPSL
jgi:16S rRNA G966 N2-methylase RsmD